MLLIYISIINTRIHREFISYIERARETEYILFLILSDYIYIYIYIEREREMYARDMYLYALLCMYT